jgi:hypothetical protein
MADDEKKKRNPNGLPLSVWQLSNRANTGCMLEICRPITCFAFRLLFLDLIQEFHDRQDTVSNDGFGIAGEVEQ